MSKRSIEKLADKIIRLSPEESQQLGLIIKAKLLPEMAKKQAGLLEQQANNPQAQQQMAMMGQRPGGQMPMPNSRQAAMQGLLRQGDRKVNMPKGKGTYGSKKGRPPKKKKKKKKKVRY